MQRLCLIAIVCVGCAPARAPAPASAGVERPGIGSTPQQMLAYAIDLLERREYRRFIEDLIAPKELQEMKKTGEDARGIRELAGAAGEETAADLRAALASVPRTRQDGALEYPLPGTTVRPLTLVRQNGHWFFSFDRPEREAAPPQIDLVLLYVRIPRSLSPIDRGLRYEEPIDEVMRAHKVGSVTGGGSMFSGKGRIKFVGIDVHVTDAARALPLLRQKLRKLGVPKGTVIEETRGIGPFRDADARTITHKVW